MTGHRVSNSCDCQPCLDAKYLAREVNRLRGALRDIVQYRRRVGVLGFQVEKFDELVRRAVVALDGGDVA